jgi:E3 ubiquitin-protein ligase BRE1
MNTRLQQQSVEKDDMNAKSLSSILHLKQLSEQLEQEKDILEKNLKSAQQLALAARLAAFAKAKVEAEAKREKAAFEEQIQQEQANSASLLKEKTEIAVQLAISKTEVESSKSDMEDIKKRCDELVATTAEHEKERRKLEEALVIAK